MNYIIENLKLKLRYESQKRDLGYEEYKKHELKRK